MTFAAGVVRRTEPQQAVHEYRAGHRGCRRQARDPIVVDVDVAAIALKL
ncbi:hypothetical protein [Kribbella antiqua]|nr:hypothetical protein [Kribbella antiqua]